MQIFKEIYKEEIKPHSRENDTTPENEDNRLKRNFKKKFRDLADQVVGLNIHRTIQIGNLEALQ